LKIKSILRTSLFLLLAYCNSSLALAIHDVAITSSLGEPLIAQINITDVEKLPDTGCFSVTDTSASPAFTNASLAIKHKADGYQLTIKSLLAITEPILNLRVVHHCEPNINRDYVVLLDPPLQNDVKTRTDNSETTTLSSHHQNEVAKPVSSPISANSTAAPAPRAAKTNISKKKKVANTAKTPSIDEKLTAMYTGQPPATASAGNQDGALKSRPYLSISGGDSQSAESLTLPNPALRLETKIDLSREEQVPTLSDTDVMDEITAMDNRLALLRTQIISLQATNEKLKNDAETAKNQLDDSKKTLRIAAGLIALVALLAFAAWLRRKQIHERLTKIEDNWLNNSNLINHHDNLTDPAVNNPNQYTYGTKNANFNDAFDDNSTYGIASGFSAQPPYASTTTSINSNVKEDILESADVLTEYGRFGLAIHLLQDYLADHPSESPKVWLKLLSLIAAHGTEPDYIQAVADCNNYYHINMPSFTEAKKVGTATIEDFPFITKELELAWGTSGAVVLLNDLIYNSASQPEDGFEPEIFEQLFMLKQIAENLNADPASANAMAEQKSIYANESNPESHHAESASAISQTAASFTSEPVNQVYETSSDELATSIHDALPQKLSVPETFPAINFDDYATEQHPVEMLTGNTEFEAATLPSLAGNNASPVTRPTLEAPEIDFSQQIKEVADTQNSTTPAIGEKPQKRIVKDSNLIDWVLTDES
jgi:hypothetical protein